MIKEKGRIKERYNRAVKRLRRNVESINECDFIDNKDIKREYTPFLDFGIDNQEYQEAQKLKKRLMIKYHGKLLEDEVKGREVKTEKGECFRIQYQYEININVIDKQSAREKILSDLKIIYGIGDVTERILKEEGYKTIEDLTIHPRFAKEASRFLKIIEKTDIRSIVQWIEYWFPVSHPLVLYSSAFFSRDEYVILDIETMGLFNRPIILIGVAQISDGSIIINQYFVRSIKDEPATLIRFLSHINNNNVFITYNGRTFDIPYIRERLAFYRIKGILDKPHYDILHFARRAWKGMVPDCRLTTIEKYLFEVIRKDDVPGALVPEFYETYMKTGNIGTIIPIIEHNRQDLITLANMFSRLHEEWG